MQESTMRLRLMLAVAALTVVVGGGVAIAAHAPEIDPATVPTGFFVAHNRVADLPVAPIARAVKPDGADVFVQHLSPGANQARMAHASRTGGRDRAQWVIDLPGRVVRTFAAIAHTRRARGSSIPASATCTG